MSNKSCYALQASTSFLLVIGVPMFNQLDKPQAGETIAIMKTNHGTMKLRLFEERVGECATNFIELAKQGKYDGAPFHRIIKDFMIQGGDFTRKNGTGGHAAGGPGTTIGDKYDPCLTHMRGALSWAKTAMPHSIGSQFFIVHGENVHFLDRVRPALRRLRCARRDCRSQDGPHGPPLRRRDYRIRDYRKGIRGCEQ